MPEKGEETDNKQYFYHGDGSGNLAVLLKTLKKLFEI